MKKNEPEEKNGNNVDPRITFFDAQAPNWDENGPNPDEIIHQLEGIKDMLGLVQGMDILEVGCGTGQLTEWLAGEIMPGRVTGVDFSGAMLERARTKNLHAEFVRADVCSDYLGEGQYDIAFCFHCFPHFRDKVYALKNISRALKDGGTILIIHLGSSRDINDFHDHIGGVVAGDHLPEISQWKYILEQAGLLQRQIIDRKGLFMLQAVKNPS